MSRRAGAGIMQAAGGRPPRLVSRTPTPQPAGVAKLDQREERNAGD